MITFRVLGQPAPQGSKTRMPNGVMLDGKSPGARAKHKAWRSAVADAAHEHRAPDGPLDGPLSLTITFRMPRPKAAKTAYWCDKRPDSIKVTRSTEDAIVDAGVVTDDARFVRHVIERIYADPCDPWTGAEITITQLDRGAA